jgi:hypothetical protein
VLRECFSPFGFRDEPRVSIMQPILQEEIQL